MHEVAVAPRAVGSIATGFAGAQEAAASAEGFSLHRLSWRFRKLMSLSLLRPQLMARVCGRDVTWVKGNIYNSCYLI